MAPWSIQMLQVSMVHAAADAELARRLGSYLERNCLVNIDYDSRAGKDEPLLDVLGRALSSDVVILLLSPDSVPVRLAREQWEPLLVESAQESRTHIAYVTVADCAFP